MHTDTARKSRKRILVVDDQEIDLQILTKILQTDYEVCTAHNGQEALALLTSRGEHYIDAILLDLLMPVMNGYEFLQRLGLDEKLKVIPVIVGTSSDDPGSEEKVLLAGAWDFLSKPYNPMVLKLRVENSLLRSQRDLWERLSHQMNYDVLTELPNKQKFLAEVKNLLDAAPEEFFSLIVLDLDHFKIFNSFFGMAKGNQLLQQLAACLTDFTVQYAPLTVIGRMGDDYFALCLPLADDQKLQQAVDDLCEAFSHLWPNFKVTASFGICKIPAHEQNLEKIIDSCELALKEAKKGLGGCSRFYHPLLRHVMEHQHEIISEMKPALADRQFKIWLQPQYQLEQMQLCGGEALVRWQHPTKGLITPNMFVPIFEHNGFISQMDMYVWEEACRSLRAWLDQDLKPVPVSINISRVDLFTLDISSILERLLSKYHLPASLLTLEITESIFTEDIKFLAAKISDLKDKGFRISMDDFGSGYSSLNVLKDMDVDVLKIDLRFFSVTPNLEKSRVIIHAVVDMAHKLGIKVVAEGVEKQEQVDFLRQIGCDVIQGYFSGRPMPGPEYDQLLREKIV